MTQKELSYIEDAIKHEKNIINICNNYIDNICDEDLISFIKKEVKRHQTLKKKLISELECECDE